jgi:hypothetical protein
VGRITANDYALAQEGTYAGHLRIKNGDPRLEALVRPWREEVDEHPELLRGVAEKYFSLPEPLEFHYMYIGEDSVAHRVLLRYFAYDPHPVIMAGWQVQLVFDAGTKRLLEVYTTEVPLE